MDLQSIEQLVRRVPQLANAPQLHIAFLAGGITNKNYRVDTDDESYVLRLAGEKTGLLGIDRRTEVHNHRIAAALGIAPEVIAFLEPEQYLVTKFVAGEKIPPEQMREPAMLRAIVLTLRTYHQGPAFAGAFSPFAVFDDYLGFAREHKAPLPKNIAFIEKFRRDVGRALYHRNPPELRPIHADLLNENFVRDRDSIRIFDWEYSGMGDIFFDLANLADHHHFSDVDEQVLLENYFGQFRERDRARLKLMRIMSDAREALWGMVQCTVSELDFDFVGYSNEFFDRLLRQATDVRYPTWLKTAADL